ncbi:hypothetical protein VRC24_00685 [Pseudomonas poae]|uniref:Uncharacterized protein n=1 Tax=Pseudomonas poae TaxID=200451 RepID=A0ABY0RL46_9PSED|nr:hypothetical protein [Pseudomonas poae]SDO24230.1 hypothetical protein SAMN04490208_3078 [Pseudomonas poae]
MKVGDVFAIETTNGKAYFQFVKKIPPMGSLIRVLPGTYKTEPNVNALVEEKTNFWIFFPVSAALKQGLIQKAKSCNVPGHSKETPTFRAGVVDPSTGRVDTWWFWNGDKEWKVGEITEEQRKLPIRGSWNDTLLVQRIEEGWLPEKDRR